MHWAALLTDTPATPSTERPAGLAVPLAGALAGSLAGSALGPQAGVAVWALQYTPRVALLDEAVVLELESSLRLYGGEDVLHPLIESGAAELGVSRAAWASTSLAALALARSVGDGGGGGGVAGGDDGRAGPAGPGGQKAGSVFNGLSLSLAQVLDPLPLASLTAVAAHAPTLARLGCRTLADVRRLPRGGVGRRFGKQLLEALDQAYGLRPEVHRWVAVPETFDARLELPGRVDTAPALLFGARRLLMQLGGWLAARHDGVTAFTLRWCHDAMRSRHVGDGGELTVRTAQPTQNVDHLCRLLGEHLAHVALQAPVGDLQLLATEVMPVTEASRSLLPDEARQREPVAHVLERIAIRLGPKRVLRPHLVEDHRTEWMQCWRDHDHKPANGKARSVGVPQPSWVLKTPLQLAVIKDRPMYQGPLQLLLGPERVDAGWWHRVSGQKDGEEAEEAQEAGKPLPSGQMGQPGPPEQAGQPGRLEAPAPPDHHLHVHRDYWVAASAHAGVLWVFQQRGRDGFDWFLHGHFA